MARYRDLLVQTGADAANVDKYIAGEVTLADVTDDNGIPADGWDFVVWTGNGRSIIPMSSIPGAADLHDLPAALLCAAHPRMTASGARVGIAARRVVEAARTPVIELGIIDADAIEGGLGAGIYRPPMSVFSEAVTALDREV